MEYKIWKNGTEDLITQQQASEQVTKGGSRSCKQHDLNKMIGQSYRRYNDTMARTQRSGGKLKWKLANTLDQAVGEVKTDSAVKQV